MPPAASHTLSCAVDADPPLPALTPLATLPCRREGRLSRPERAERLLRERVFAIGTVMELSRPRTPPIASSCESDGNHHAVTSRYAWPLLSRADRGGGELSAEWAGGQEASAVDGTRSESNVARVHASSCSWRHDSRHLQLDGLTSSPSSLSAKEPRNDRSERLL